MSKRFKFLLLTLLIGLAHGQSGVDFQAHPAGFTAALENAALKIGTDCSEHRPCNVRFGNVVHSFKTPATIKTSDSSSGLVFVYVDSSGSLTAASTVKLVCQGCSYAPGVKQFPSGSIPLFTWTVVGGAFEKAGLADFRAILSTTPVASGSGIMIIENAGVTTVSVDPTLVSLHVLQAPKTSRDTCAAGQFSFDDDYYYICVGVNTWKRFALSSF